jgi:hypothetical protein
MSVLKDDGTKRLIDQILASLKIGKYAIMDKVLNINSKNPVENGVITQAINGVNNRIDDECLKGEIVRKTLSSPSSGTRYYKMEFGQIKPSQKWVILDAGFYTFTQQGFVKMGVSGANNFYSSSETIAPTVDWIETNNGTGKTISVTVDTKTSQTQNGVAYAVVLFY